MQLSEAVPDGRQFRLDRRARESNIYLEKNMNIKNIITTVVLFAVAGPTFAQQTEFLAPDAGFKPALTRAQVRQDLAHAYTQGNVVQRQHDGQEPQFAGGTQSRDQVRKEAARAAQTRPAGDVSDLYFGA